jgi:hypothetical protein
LLVCTDRVKPIARFCDHSLAFTLRGPFPA